MDDLLKQLALQLVKDRLVLPTGDLPAVAADIRKYLQADMADPALEGLNDAQMASIAKAADKALIDYMLGRIVRQVTPR